jgi:hypothetical protein
MSEENGGSAPVEASSQEESTPVVEESQQEIAAPAAEVAEDLKDAVEEAIENGASKEEVKSIIKEYQLKVNGKVKNVKVDLSDDNYIKSQLQLAEAARERMQESAEIKKLMQQEFLRLQQNPWEVLQELGYDPDEMSRARLEETVKQRSKPQEQIEKEKYQKELEEARAEAKKLKEEKENLEFNKLQEQAAVQIEQEIISALDGHKSLPHSKHVVKRIADSMLWAMDNGFEDVTADDVIPLVENELREELNRFMDDMPDELLERFISNQTFDRMKKKKSSANKIQPKAVPSLSSIKPTANEIKVKKEEPPKRIDSRSFFKNLAK